MTRPPVRGDESWRPAHARADEPGGDVDVDDPGDERFDDGEYEVLRRQSSTGRRVAIVLLSLFVLLIAFLAIIALVVRGRLDPSGEPGEEVRLAIPTGFSNGDIATLLEEESVIVDSQAFRYYLRYKDAAGFQAGDYLFRENSAAWHVLDVLEGQPLAPETLAFTVPEGLTLRQYAEEVVNDVPAYDATRIAELLAGVELPRPATLPPEATTYEGFVFPDTYQVEEGMDEAMALTLMIQQFDRVAADVGLVDGAARLGLTPYEVVTVASLIQEEYGIVEEMPKIARVIYNRLDVGEPLGVDATSRYEAELAGRDRNDIDFESDSPYNTRRNAGLPPTPIAAPGRAALEAALNPVDGPWIFYVRDPDTSRTPEGGHFFTDSSSEFAEVKDQCEEANLGCG